MNFFKKALRFILSFGPGIFAIGYTIGTGSVTSMIVAGNNFGMQLLWVLFLSCLFSGVLIYVSGSYSEKMADAGSNLGKLTPKYDFSQYRYREIASRSLTINTYLIVNSNAFIIKYTCFHKLCTLYTPL